MNISNFSLAVRENNSKRRHIVVNKMQGRYFPCSPSIADATLDSHANEIRQFMKSSGIAAENIVVIGFAEAAVAIGAYIARRLDAFYVTSTREILPGYFDTISFEESHSHAAGHALCIRDADIFRKADCVILAEDEFTTGNTALKLVNALKPYLSDDCVIMATAFTASAASRKLFEDNNVLCYAECSLDEIMEQHSGKYDTYVSDIRTAPRKPDVEIMLNSVFDPRIGVNGCEYYAECEKMCDEVVCAISTMFPYGYELNVVGTEECSVLPIIIGEELESRGFAVLTHCITRTPVDVCDDPDYPLKTRVRFKSLYDPDRNVFLYNRREVNKVTIIVTDADNADSGQIEAMCGAMRGGTIVIYMKGRRMRTSFEPEDCTLLLKDVTGLIEPMEPDARERAVQDGVHYSETLPAEHYPSDEYIRQFEQGLADWSDVIADAVRAVSERIYSKGRNVIVSLARAGTPIGALIVRYLRKKYGNKFVHYSISIIKGKGIDGNALRYILARHSPESIQFVDGWTGKGIIAGELARSLADYPGIDSSLAALSDPAGVCGICGTRDDIFIPCSCLNSIVSGLFSRTILRKDIAADYDFHGAVYFTEFEDRDRSYEFIEAVESAMTYDDADVANEECGCSGRPVYEIDDIAKTFHAGSVDLVKPGIGETTRALLRRVPEFVLVDKKGSPFVACIEKLAAEKGVPVREYPLKNYHACAVIRTVAEA